MSNTRYIAAQVVNHVMSNGQSLSDSLRSTLLSMTDPRDRALVQAIAYGVCRYYSRLEFVLDHLLKKPMTSKDNIVRALLFVGLYQLMEMRIPPHAAVAETVAATIKLKKPSAKGLVNAILREYLRRKKILNDHIKENLEAHYAHPSWLIATIKQAWPQHWQTILTVNNTHPPFALRVNLSQMSREQYVELLQKHNYIVHIIPETKAGIVLDLAIPVENLPGFDDGRVSVQDGGAQLAAELLDLKPGFRVLDACAAPGGKLMHMLELQPELSACIAIEKDPQRLLLIRENLARYTKSFLYKEEQVKLFCRDVTTIEAWWDGQAFDRILLDTPCSASGVIRRHPDIKLLRRPSDIHVLAKEQLHLLLALWPILKPGGLLLYVTCSIFHEENFQVLHHFLKSHPNAYEEKLDVSWGLPCEIGRQILPGMHGVDGFYFAKVRKTL
ncbi:MAG TPA: 16S rRNA (cytosine(967)-C(5))-methyltransferase RsmB [Gammaproteobacteria bacterium]|nr:16S rRNA (cytosine(967)-C(5))-methyltransferase RsmB [Gammaproteobacteria bacterium]